MLSWRRYNTRDDASLDKGCTMLPSILRHPDAVRGLQKADTWTFEGVIGYDLYYFHEGENQWLFGLYRWGWAAGA